MDERNLLNRQLFSRKLSDFAGAISGCRDLRNVKIHFQSNTIWRRTPKLEMAKLHCLTAKMW